MTNTVQNSVETSSRKKSGSKKSRLSRMQEAKDRLDAKEQQLTEEQAEKIRQRQQEENEMSRNKRGRKATPPLEVELPEDIKTNTTDPAIQTLKTSSGWKQGYNGQAIVDCDTQIIAYANDVQQLKPMLGACEEVNDKRPEKVLADAGYWIKANAQLGDEQT